MPKFCVSEMAKLKEAIHEEGGMIDPDDEEWKERVRKYATKLSKCLEKWDTLGLLGSKQKQLLTWTSKYRG